MDDGPSRPIKSAIALEFADASRPGTALNSGDFLPVLTDGQNRPRSGQDIWRIERPASGLRNEVPIILVPIEIHEGRASGAD